MALSTEDRKSSTRRADAPSYLAYLQTAGWRTTRNAALRRARYRCGRCGTGRQLEVHHLSYERLGNERDADIAVLCRACHTQHHLAEDRKRPEGIYLVLASEVLTRDPFIGFADLAGEMKDLCAQRGIPPVPHLIDRAIGLVSGSRMKTRQADAPVAPETPEAPVTPDQAVRLLAGIRAKLGMPDATPKPIRAGRVVTQGRADQLRAFAMVTREMEASIARCEALEHEA